MSDDGVPAASSFLRQLEPNATSTSARTVMSFLIKAATDCQRNALLANTNQRCPTRRSCVTHDRRGVFRARTLIWTPPKHSCFHSVAVPKKGSFLTYSLPVILWMALIFAGSTDLLSPHRTSRMIGPLLRW